MKITKVYTRTGDKGMTSLVGGVRIQKSNVRLESYGTIDELSSHLGLLAAMLTNDEDRQMVQRIQNDLFMVSTHLATDQSQTQLYPSAQLPVSEIEYLEQQIDAIKELLPEPQGFILPGGTRAASLAHVCRTICRRLERRIYSIDDEVPTDPTLMQYVNRLSDYMFLFAKKQNYLLGVEEKIWQKS